MKINIIFSLIRSVVRCLCPLLLLVTSLLHLEAAESTSAANAGPASRILHATSSRLVPGIFLYPTGTVMVVGTLPDHNVLSVTNAQNPTDYVITLNGQAAVYSGVLSVAYQGGAGGFDSVTHSASFVLTATLFHGSNQVTVSGGSYINLNLFGDYNTIDVTNGFAEITAAGGPNSTVTPAQNATFIYNGGYYQESSIPGIFSNGQYVQDIVIVSNQIQHDQVQCSFDSTTGIVTVTQSGHTVTFQQPPGMVTQFNYYGSWGGGDIVSNQTPFPFVASLFGDNDQFTSTASGGQNVIYLAGNDAVLNSNGSLGNVQYYGSNDQILGGLVGARYGVAPTTGSPPSATGASSGSSASATATGGTGTSGSAATSTTASASASATGTGNGGTSNPIATPNSAGSKSCGIGGAIGGMMFISLTRLTRRRQRERTSHER
jgi:hypothetical protein